MDDSRKKQPDLLSSLLNHWPAALAGQSVEAGLSGGMDSMVLLDLLWRCREQRHFHLSAVHVHHGLSQHADVWAQHCADWCADRQIPLRVERVRVQPGGGESLEAVARRERYAVYRQSQAGVVALAHHLDDQSETVLLQLLRGGGPHALAAMPVWRALDERVSVWRPLLCWSRGELEQYAKARDLSWVTDESNADTRWRRNLLRHDILPLIAAAQPDYRHHLQRTAQLMAQAADILDEVAAADLAACLVQGRLLLPRFVSLSEARQRQLLVRWIAQLEAGEVTPDGVESFRQQLLQAGEDRHPALRLSGKTLFRYRDQVWAVSSTAMALPDEQRACYLPTVGPEVFVGGQLQLIDHEQGVAHQLLQGGFFLRPRRGGERLPQPVGNKPVKTLLQEAGIPPMLRERWPLLYLADGRLAAIPSVAVASDCRGESGQWPVWLPA